MHKTNVFPRSFRLLFSLFLLLGLLACNNDDDDGGGGGTTPEPQPTCDETRRPIIFVHGFLGSGDTYAGQVQRFSSNGYCDERLFVFDWNSLGDREAVVGQLDAFIEAVRSSTGADRVDLAGHSAGGGIGYQYLADAGRAAKVAHYAHLASFQQAGPAGPAGEVPTLNVWSSADEVIDMKGDIPGAENVAFDDLDHYQAATAPETFAAMYTFFNEGEAPQTETIEPETEIEVSGRVLTFGENQPRGNATVEIYALDEQTGERLDPLAPSATFLTDAEGRWGPFLAAPEIYYEFFIQPASGEERPLHYYREPFVRSTPLVYLRTLPDANSTAGLLLAGLPRDDRQSVLAIFSSSQAVIHPRDLLRIDGFELATAVYAPKAATNITFFLYDDGDQQTSGNPHPLFQLLPTFITGIDYFIPTEPRASVRLELNGRPLTVPTLPSASEGVLIAVFD